MPGEAVQGSNSLVAFFPASIYHNVGSLFVLPQLLKTVDKDKLAVVQFLRNGAVHLTFKSTADCDHIVPSGIFYGDTSLRVVSVDARSKLTNLCDCPCEVPDSAVSGFFATYGEVHSIICRHEDFPRLLVPLSC